MISCGLWLAAKGYSTGAERRQRHGRLIQRRLVVMRDDLPHRCQQVQNVQNAAQRTGR